MSLIERVLYQVVEPPWKGRDCFMGVKVNREAVLVDATFVGTLEQELGSIAFRTLKRVRPVTTLSKQRL